MIEALDEILGLDVYIFNTYNWLYLFMFCILLIDSSILEFDNT